jgi:predicted Zn finger-like uncharacterized protein
MALRLTCPSCRTSQTIDDSKRGRKVRCEGCDKVLNIPAAPEPKKKRDEEAIQDKPKLKVKTSPRRDDDDDDDQPRKKKAKKSGGSSLGLILVGGGVVVLLLTCVAGGAGFFLLRSTPAVAEPVPLANVDDKKVAPPENPPKKEAPPPKVNPKPPVDPDAGKPLPVQMTPDIVRRVKEATVYLRVASQNNQVAEGSGFLALEPGIVITNAHVLGMLSAKSQPPKQVEVVANSGEPNEVKMTGQVVGVDRSNDLAVVRVNMSNQPTPLFLDDNRQLTETQKVYIFGFPYGAQLGKNITVSESSVSSLRKNASGALEQIQVNGGMHPGNSGGPVVNALGRLVGVSVAGIRGTQINFAVPADYVRMIMDGRLSDSVMGEAYVQNGQAKLPMKFACLDPLNRVRQMRVEVWTGSPGAERPYSLQQPQPLAGDGARQTHPVSYQNGAASFDIPLPQLGAGQVCWVQPVITNSAGAVQWGTAIATSPSLVPVERKQANLTPNFTAQKERTTRIKSSSSLTLAKGKEKKTFADKVDFEMLEVLGPDPKGAVLRTSFGNIDIRSEEDGRVLTRDPQMAGMLRQLPPVFVLYPNNRVQARADRNLNSALPVTTRLQIQDSYWSLCNAIEAATIALPNRVVQPLETFNIQIPMMLRAGKNPEVVDLDLVGTLEGTRKRDQRDEGVVSLRGKVNGRGPSSGKIAGEVTGKFAFDLTGGFVSQVMLRIGSEFETSEIQVADAFEIDLTRVAGNPSSIPQPSEPKSTPDVAMGKLLLNQGGVLANNDAFVQNPKLPKNARMKVATVQLQAGKTYVINLKSGSFDPYLLLQGPTGQIMSEDDDGGGFPNARITIRAAQTGIHRVVITSFDGKTGPFQLTINESTGK